MFCPFIPLIKLLEQLFMIASIEAPFALLEKQMKILRLNAVETAHMPLGLIPKILDSIDVIGSLGEKLAMVYTTMMKGAYVKSVVSLKGIRIDDTVRGDLLLDNRQQRGAASIGNYGGINPSAPLEQAEDRHLPGCSTTSLAFASSSEIAFVGLYFAAQLEARKLAGYELSQTQKETRGGVAVHSADLRGGPSSGSRHEKLDQLALLSRTQTTTPFIHNTILI